MGNPYQEQNPSLPSKPSPESIDEIDGWQFELEVPVRGRGKLVAKAYVDMDGSCTIRIDDAADDAFWAEVWLGAQDQDTLRRVIADARRTGIREQPPEEGGV